MRKIYLMAILLSILVGCQSSKKIDKVVPKKQDKNYILYKLSIENNGMVYIRKIEPISYHKELLFAFSHKEWGKLLFKMNRKSYVDIKIPKKISQKKLTHIYTVISKKDNSEKLLGEFQIDAVEGKEPQIGFINYVYLKNNEIERYNKSQKAREELTHSHDWVKVLDLCDGYIALKKDGSLWKFGDLRECGWGGLDIIDNKFMNRNIYTYHLTPKKIATGFKDAKLINGGLCFYAIKKDGTLWSNYIDTKFKQVGRDSDWVSIGVGIGVDDGLNYDIGLKKDGSLWKIYHNKISSLSKNREWDKVWMERFIIYAQKKDGSLWSGPSDAEYFKKVTKDKDEILKIMEKIPSQEVQFFQNRKDINLSKNGRLFLAPKINNEEVHKNRAITLYPNRKQIVEIAK